MVLLVCSRYASVWCIVSENVFHVHHLKKALVLSRLGTLSLLIAYKFQTYQFFFLFLWRLHPPSLLLSLLISLLLPLSAALPGTLFSLWCLLPLSLVISFCLRCCTVLSLSLIISPSLRSRSLLSLSLLLCFSASPSFSSLFSLYFFLKPVHVNGMLFNNSKTNDTVKHP